MNAQIEALARKKKFAALGEKEKELVLKEMSEAEYDRLFQVLAAARMQYARAEAPAQLRARLLGHKALRAQPSAWDRLLHDSTPLWRAAAIFVLGMAAAMLMRKTKVVENTITEVQYRVDTVYRDQVQWRDRVLWKTKVVYVEKTMPIPVASLPEKTEAPAALPDFNSKDLHNTASGTSLGDTPELMQFFTQGEK